MKSKTPRVSRRGLLAAGLAAGLATLVTTGSVQART